MSKWVYTEEDRNGVCGSSIPSWSRRHRSWKSSPVGPPSRIRAGGLFPLLSTPQLGTWAALEQASDTRARTCKSSYIPPLFLPQVPLLPIVIHVSVVTSGFLLRLERNEHNSLGIQYQLTAAESPRKTQPRRNGFHSYSHVSLGQCIESMWSTRDVLRSRIINWWRPGDIKVTCGTWH